MNSSLAGLDEFEQCSVCCGGRIHGVGSDPKILLSCVYHFPDCFEELVTLDDELGFGKPKYLCKLPLLDFLADCCVLLVKGLSEYLVEVHIFRNV